MNNISENNSSTSASSYINRFIAHFNLITIALGVVGNTVSFLIFRFHPSFKRMPSMVYLSFVAVTDTIALFEWNLNHFTVLTYKFDLPEQTNIAFCRIFSFAQYFSLQSSALILSVMCIDRYLTVVALPGSFLHKLPFRTNTSAVIWSVGIIMFTIGLNFHILLYCGLYITTRVDNTTSVKVDCSTCSNGINLSPTWDRVNLVFYNIIPFLVMMTFNILLIINLYIVKSHISNYKENSKSAAKRRNLTFSLLLLTFLFLAMTVPGTILFAFFYDNVLSSLDLSSIYMIDDISFLNNSMIFFVCLISNRKFRNTVFQMCRCNFDFKKSNSSSIKY